MRFIACRVCVLLLLFVSCTSSKNKEVINEMDQLDEMLITETAEDITVTNTDSGFVKVVLTSPLAITIKHPTDPTTEMPKGLNAVFYNKLGQEESNISAQYGISYDKQNLVVLKNNVQVKNEKNEKLNTEELTWNRVTKKIYTDKFVTITTPTETLSGYEMEADEDFSNWFIKKASGKFNLAP